MAVPLIASLILAGCPAAVAGLVIPVVVDSLNLGTPERAFAHVGKESLKRFYPCRMNRDPAPAVVGKIRAVRIGATVSHLRPSLVFGCLAHPVTASTIAEGFAAQTPARLGVSLNQCAGRNAGCRSAVAKASPHGEVMMVRAVAAGD